MLILLLTASIAASAQWQWAKKFTAPNANDAGKCITSDANGNIYLAGDFKSDTLTWGATQLTNFNTGTLDIAFAKCDASGNLLWAKTFGNSKDDWMDDICVDPDGNLLLTGTFTSDSLTFGNLTIYNTSGTNLTNLFVAKFDAHGNEIWAKSYGGTWSETAGGITTNAAGSIFITGSFTGSTVNFGGITLNSVGNSDVLIAKLDSAGNVQWAKGFGSTSGDGGTGIATDAQGNVLVTGANAVKPITFDTVALNGDVFLVKLDPNGNLLWAREGVASDNQMVYTMDLTIDDADNATMVGSFASPTLTFGSHVVNSAGDYDIFIAKYNSAGTPLWAKVVGNTKDDGPWCVRTRNGNQTIIAGYFKSSTLTFDSHTIINSSTYNTNDVYLCALDSAGNTLWATKAGGNLSDRPYGMCIHHDGGIVITGYANNEAAFGSDTLYGYTDDFFVAKYSDGTSTSVSELSTQTSVNIFPNPFTINATLHSTNSLTNATLLVTDMAGRTISIIKNVSGHVVTISLDSLPGGMYFVQLWQNNAVIATKKLMVTN